MSVLVIVGHPNPNSFNHALAAAYVEGAARTGATVERIDLHTLDFDLSLRGGHDADQPLEPDLVEARAAIDRAEHVVVVFPVWWGGMPALMKGFVDRIFLPGWAFKYTDGPFPERLMAGKSARLVTTMDAPVWYYSTVYGRTVHRSAISSWLKYVGFGPVRQSVVYALRELDARAREAWLDRLREAGASDAAPLAHSRPTLEAAAK